MSSGRNPAPTTGEQVAAAAKRLRLERAATKALRRLCRIAVKTNKLGAKAAAAAGQPGEQAPE